MATIFITMPIFGDGKYFGAVINWGELEDGKVVYPTNHGIKKTAPTEFEKCFKLYSLSDFDLEKSLRYWRDKNPKQSGKKFVIDESIETGEVYNQYSWMLSIMIRVTKTEIKIKPLLNQ